MLRSQTIELSDLTPSETSALADELYVVHRQVFGGVSRDAFAEQVLGDGSSNTRIRIYRDTGGQAVGYFASYRHATTFAGQECTVFRADAGLMPEYRGKASTWRFGICETLRYRCRHPFERILFFELLVHPSSYCLFAERFPEIHPSRKRETGPELLKAMTSLADEFGYRSEKGAPLIRFSGWFTKEKEKDIRKWRASSDRDAQFFLERNPGYGKGDGLVVLVPLSFTNILGAIANDIGLRSRRALRAACRP